MNFMTSERPLFILAGNSPYTNRGCEAYTRGTVKIIRKYFSDPVFLCHSRFHSYKQFKKQCMDEKDDAITHLYSYVMSRESIFSNLIKPENWLYAYRSIIKSQKLKYSVYHEIIPHMDRALAILSIGGDNYSLDYGIPTLYIDLDNIVIEKKKPIIIWGASVGPFNNNPNFEKNTSVHLRKVNGIFARESVTIDYLKSIGVVNNVFHTADPAFLLDSEKPNGVDNYLPIDGEAIGINLSPLMANYVTNGNYEQWVRKAASIIEDIYLKYEMPLYLIPHVTMPSPSDYEFMRRALSRIKKANREIILVPPKFNAAETKWIISKMKIFAGARFHSTVDSFSSCVPTLSFAYSSKAWGINRDIYGHSNYCISPNILDTEHITNCMDTMLNHASSIKIDLNRIIPTINDKAMSAGAFLKEIIS